jgi:hypothetical protein
MYLNKQCACVCVRVRVCVCVCEHVDRIQLPLYSVHLLHNENSAKNIPVSWNNYQPCTMKLVTNNFTPW